MATKYTNYDAIDFAEDASFIRWVRGSDPKAKHFWESWQQAHPEKAGELKEAKVLVKAIKVIEEEPSKERIQNLWDKIDVATVQKEKEASIVRRLNTHKWMSYAAAACIGLIAFFYLYTSPTTVNAGNGEHLVYKLPDNSRIELNAHSKIVYKKRSFAKERVVELEGEAFFEIEKGGSFRVITSQGEVEVLGTSFNINTRNGGLKVDCKTGSVKVTANGNSQILTKGQGTNYNVAKAALETVHTSDIEKKTGWRKGDFYFTDVSFSEVIEELERQYDVKIECDAALKDKKGNYVFKGKLEEALESVSYQLNAQPIIEGKKVKIMIN